jgi:hypothetical protein
MEVEHEDLLIHARICTREIEDSVVQAETAALFRNQSVVEEQMRVKRESDVDLFRFKYFQFFIEVLLKAHSLNNLIISDHKFIIYLELSLIGINIGNNKTYIAIYY